jgi:TetR/AcrR family fatty acid metabolism transcriptional regulator
MEDEKRTKILEAATKVFAEKGFQYAKITDVVKESGISTGMIYTYFRNKLDILLSIIVLFLQRINQLNQDKLQSLDDPKQKLLAVLHNFEALLIKDDKSLTLVKVLNEALPHIVLIPEKDLQEKRQEIIEGNQKLINRIDKIILEGQQKGVFNDTLNYSVLRQMLCGAIEMLIYGLFFQRYSKEAIGYEQDEAHKAVSQLIDRFICK